MDEKGAVQLRNATAYKDDSELLFFSDNAISDDGQRYFQLVGNKGQVLVFDIRKNGDLNKRETLDGLPVHGSYGLVVL